MTEQRSAGVVDAPAALATVFAERLSPAKRVRVPFNPRDRWLTATREACRTLAEAVASSLAAGGRPVVLGGECVLAVGALSGALAATASSELHLVWMDAHADFHTLATTRTHEVNEMCLAHLCGRSVAPLLWPGARHMLEERVVLVGARAMDAGEAANLTRTKVRRVPFDAAQDSAPGLLTAIKRKDVWIHLATDLIDPSDCPAVARPEPGGPSLKAVAEVLRSVASITTVRGITLCGYDPRQSPEEADFPGALADLVAGACLTEV